MALAYSILAYKSPDQLERLFRAIYHAEDLFVLHIDRRAADALHAFGRRMVTDHSNVMLLPSRAILWGGSVMAEKQIEAMEAALVRSSHWNHFINLSGQDFPLKSREEMLDRLSEKSDCSYVSWFDPLACDLWKNARTRLSRYYLEWPWLHRLLHLPGIGRKLRGLFGVKNALPFLPFYRRSWPDFFRYYGGANHVILTREACDYLTTDPDALRIMRWLRHSAHANEIIFQSVLLNSPLRSRVINAHLREIVFPSPDSPHPTTFTLNDLPRLLNSPALFGRKFDLNVDTAVIRALEERARAVPAYQ